MYAKVWNYLRGSVLFRCESPAPERVLNLSIFRAGIIAYFKKFSEAMTGMDFPQFEKEIRAWAQERDAV